MILSVCALVENDQEEILLVKTHARSDTWEFPGGQVEKNESLHEAVCREVREETGIIIDPVGITGVYQNFSANVVCVVFFAKYISGKITKQVEEIQDARFVKINRKNLDTYITRPNFQSRYFDAIRKKTVPVETWANSFRLVKRYGD